MTTARPEPVRHVTDAERRARIAARHALAPAHRAASPEAVTNALTVLHATEPATVHLACRARMASVARADVDRALYAERTLVKQLAMRRTLFVFPRDLLAAAWGSASARVAATERKRMAKEIVLAGLDDDGDAWLERARREVLAHLHDVPDGLQTHEIRAAVPTIDVKVTVTPSAPWSASRVLTYLGATADLVAGENTSHWRVSRPRRTLMAHWLGDVPAPAAPAAGYRELVRRYLRTFGPATEDDVVWWLGATKGIVRAAFAELGVVAVSLDGGATGWLLPDDLEETAPVDAWVALLGVLDPTVMGWKARDFYLGAHRDRLFDRAGNAGTTAWVDGRIVGCWVQAADGVVEPRLLEPVSAAARRALGAEAARLTEWLAGERVGTTVPSPAMRA